MASKYLFINTRDELLRLDCTKVVYMEGDGNYTNIILANKIKTPIGMNLSEMQRLITESRKERASIYARIGKRYIINLKYLYRINTLQQTLTLTDSETFAYQLKVSKEALKQLKAMIVQGIKSSNNKE